MTAATAVRRKKPEMLMLDEGQCMVFAHRPDPVKSRAAIDATIERGRADKRPGDVLKAVKEFRDNPRG